MKKIAKRYFVELVSNGHSVPRNEVTGETLTFAVGRTYTIGHNEGKDTVKAKCTQNCPCALVLVKE